MASDQKDKQGISRRDFNAQLGAAAAGVAVGGDLLGSRVSAASFAPGRVIGANDRVVLAQHRHPRTGQRAQARLRAAAERRDQDALRHRRQPRAGAHQRRAAGRTSRRSSRGSCRTCGAPSTTRTSTPIVIAAPNHWHALATVWGLQAGKHVFVEKPASHTVLGRPPDDRGGGALQEAGAGRHDEPQPAAGDGGDQVHPRRRHRQGLHGARAVLQAAAVDRQVSRRPDGARREIRAHGRRRRTTSRPTTSSTCRRSITTCGSAPRRSARSIAIASTTTGTGTGTTATATPATRARTSSTPRAGA